MSRYDKRFLWVRCLLYLALMLFGAWQLLDNASSVANWVAPVAGALLLALEGLAAIRLRRASRQHTNQHI